METWMEPSLDDDVLSPTPNPKEAYPRECLPLYMYSIAPSLLHNMHMLHA